MRVNVLIILTGCVLATGLLLGVALGTFHGSQPEPRAPMEPSFTSCRGRHNRRSRPMTLSALIAKLIDFEVDHGTLDVKVNGRNVEDVHLLIAGTSTRVELELEEES
jgi:hypothetical protein